MPRLPGRKIVSAGDDRISGNRECSQRVDANPITIGDDGVRLNNIVRDRHIRLILTGNAALRRSVELIVGNRHPIVDPV